MFDCWEGDETSCRSDVTHTAVRTRMPARLQASHRPIETLRVADIVHMEVGLKNRLLGTGTPLTSPIGVSLVAIALVVLVFIGDWITPATTVVGLAYQAPIVFAGLRGTRNLTIQVTVLGLVGLSLGWFMDLAASSFHFSAERIENRLLSVLSLLIVSCLTLRSQRSVPTAIQS